MPESGVAAAAVEPAAEAVAVEEETVARGKNGGKGRKRPSLPMSGRGRRQSKRAREPAVVEVIIKLLIKLEPLLHGTDINSPVLLVYRKLFRRLINVFCDKRA